MLLSAVKNELSNQLMLRSIRRYRSRVGWQSAGKYERYLAQCRANYSGSLPAEPAVVAAVEKFRKDGVLAFGHPRRISSQLSSTLSLRNDSATARIFG